MGAWFGCDCSVQFLGTLLVGWGIDFRRVRNVWTCTGRSLAYGAYIPTQLDQSAAQPDQVSPLLRDGRNAYWREQDPFVRMAERRRGGEAAACGTLRSVVGLCGLEAFRPGSRAATAQSDLRTQGPRSIAFAD